jgi:thioredoxin-like negative regulator of GroEL
MVAPILETLAGNFAGRIKVVKVNVDDSPLASNRFQARSIPLLVFLKDGNTVDTMLGAHPEHAIASKIESLLG